MSASQAPTFATAITLARGRWGKTALVRLTWVAGSWVASAGHTTTVGSGVDLPCTGCGDDAPAAIAALCESIERPALDPAEEVLAGLEGEHDMPATWRCVPWKARGGYGGQRNDGTVNENRHRERLWLSPHCEGARQLSLLGGAP